MILDELIEAACVLEATATKPGNVHPECGFTDLQYSDFLSAAQAVRKPLATASLRPVGATIRRAVIATRNVVPSNPNLGIILLLAPLAAVPPDDSLDDGINEVLQSLSVEDAIDTYAAIRQAQPGGLGEVDSADVENTPDITLLEAMRLARDRDLIARQYVTGFADVLQAGPRWFMDWQSQGLDWEQCIVGLYLDWMSTHPDSLVARKLGPDAARDVQSQAASVLAAGWPESDLARNQLREFDRWLRGDGNRRNPGTSADLVAATLFVVFRERLVQVPDMNQIHQRRSLHSIPVVRADSSSHDRLEEHP